MAETAIVEWYRSSEQMRALWWWAAAAVLVSLGLLLVAVALDTSGRVAHRWQATAGVLGVICSVGGPALGLVGLRSMMRQETSVLLRTDGVVVDRGARQQRIGWQELDEVSWQGGCLVLAGDRGRIELRERFSGIDGPGLAQRILVVQRRVLLGVVRAG